MTIRGTGQDHMNEHWPKKEQQEARGDSVCDAKMPREESSALCGDGTDSSAQKQHFLPELMSGAV